jgi:hypothetical protein
MTQAAGELADDFDVIAGAFGGLERFADSLHPAFAASHGALGFAPSGGRWQDHVCHLGRLGQEDVLDDQVLEAGEQVQGPVLIGF